MGDKKPKNSLETGNKNGPEVKKDVPKAPENLPPSLTNLKKEEKETKKTTTEKTSELKMEVLDKDIIAQDTDTAKYIQSIDAGKESKEQLPAYKRLEVVMYVMIAKIMDAGTSAEQLADFDSIKSVMPVEKFNIVEKAAFSKLQEIAGKTTSPLYREMKIYWSRFMEKAKGIYEQTSGARDVLLGKQSGEKKETKDETKIEWVLRQAKQHPYITALALAATAYGAYKIFFSSKKKEGSSEEGGESNEPGFFDSLISKLGLDSTKGKLVAGALAMMVLGGIIGHEKIGEVISKITNISKKHLDGFIALIKQGKYKEAIAFLFGFGDIKETVEKDLAWLDEKLHFTEMKEDFKKFCEEHGIQVPDAVKDFVKDLHLDEIAKELGITQGDEKSWLDYVGAGGGALLIYKFMGKKGLAINAGLYMFIVNQGRDSFGGKILRELGKLVDITKNKIIEGVKHIPGADVIIGDEFEGFQVENAMDGMLDWMKEHPFESMAIMNGAWLCRSLIFKALKKLMHSGGQVLKYIWQNPGKFLLTAGAFGLLYADRRKLILEFINLTYDDPNSAEAKEMLKSLDETFDVDRSKPESLGAKQADSLIKTMTENPLEALQKLTNWDEYKKGGWAIATNTAGAMFLLVKGVSAPIALTKLTWEAFKTMGHGFTPESDGNVLVPMLVGGVEMMVFSSMAFEGVKSYVSIIDSVSGKGGKFWRSLKSLVPGTKEWRFVWKSALSAPLVPFLRKFDSFKLGVLKKDLEEIRRLASEASPDFAKIEKLADGLRSHDLFKNFTDIKKNLTGTHYGYQLQSSLEKTQKLCEQIYTDAIKRDTKSVQALADRASKEYEVALKGGPSLLSRLKLIFEGDFKGAMSLTESADDLLKAEKEATKSAKEVEAIKVLNIKQGPLFRNKDGSFKAADELEKNVEALKKEIASLDPADLNRMTKEKELMAIEVFLGKRPLDGLKVDPSELGKLEGADKAKRVHELAQEMEAMEKGTQAKFNSEVEKIVKEAKAKNIALDSEEVMSKLEKLDKDLTIPFAKTKQKNLETLFAAYEKLPKNLKTPALNAQLRHTMEGVDGTLMTRMVKGVKGRAKMMALMAVGVFALDQYMHRNDADRDLLKIMNDLGPELGQLVLDVAPVTGTFSNYYSAISGKEIITKRDVSGTWDRMSNALWGTVGLIGDTVTVIEALPTGGETVWGNMRLRLMKLAASEGKTANTAKKLIKVMPKLEKIAERMGGLTRMCSKIGEFLKDDRILKNMRRFEKAGLVVGTAMIVGGVTYNMRYAFTDKDTEIKVPPEIMETSKLPTPDKTPTETNLLEPEPPTNG